MFTFDPRTTFPTASLPTEITPDSQQPRQIPAAEAAPLPMSGSSQAARSTGAATQLDSFARFGSLDFGMAHFLPGTLVGSVAPTLVSIAPALPTGQGVTASRGSNGGIVLDFGSGNDEVRVKTGPNGGLVIEYREEGEKTWKTLTLTAAQAQGLVIRTGDGADVVSVDPAVTHDLEIDAGEGNDKVQGGSGNDRIFGRGGNDDLRGGDGDDWIDGGAGNDVMDGEGGDDRLVDREGADKFYGGTGYDHLSGADGDDEYDVGTCPYAW